jgi:hypothetical protein
MGSIKNRRKHKMAQIYFKTPSGIKQAQGEENSGAQGTTVFANMAGATEADQTFSFTASEAQYTTKILEFAAPSQIGTDYMITVYNPSTENALKVQVKNMVESFGGNTRPAKVTEFPVSAQAARVNPAYVYYFDQSGGGGAGTYTDNTTAFTNATANDVAVPGHASGEVGDAVYIGYGNRFRKVYMNVGTAKTDVSTLVWEYYNGSTWASLTDIQDGTVGFTAAAGIYEVSFDPPINWGKVAVNSQTLFWVRCRCSAFTSAGTQGAITQGNLANNYNADVFQEPVWGLFNNGTDARLVISNETAAVGASQTVAGAGAFTGYVRITPI